MLRTLLPFERRWLRAIWRAILPSEASPRLTTGADDLPMLAYFSDLMARSPLRFLLGFHAAIWIVGLAPLFMLRRLRTFAGLPQSEGSALLDRMAHSDVYIVRELPTLLKMIVCLGYAGHPKVLDAVGIPNDGVPPDWVPTSASGASSSAAIAESAATKDGSVGLSGGAE